MTWLDDYTITHGTDNRHRYLDVEEIDSITIGGSCTHIFELPFKYTNYIKSGIIYYKQGLTVLLSIDITDDMITDLENTSIITLNLSPVQTQLFSRNALDTFAQLRLISVDDKVMFDEQHEI